MPLGRRGRKSFCIYIYFFFNLEKRNYNGGNKNEIKLESYETTTDWTRILSMIQIHYINLYNSQTTEAQDSCEIYHAENMKISSRWWVRQIPVNLWLLSTTRRLERLTGESKLSKFDMICLTHHLLLCVASYLNISGYPLYTQKHEWISQPYWFHWTNSPRRGY